MFVPVGDLGPGPAPVMQLSVTCGRTLDQKLILRRMRGNLSRIEFKVRIEWSLWAWEIEYPSDAIAAPIDYSLND